MNRKGFTLIELLIVVAIIAILAAIAIPNFLEARTRSKVSKLFADMKVLGLAEEMYHVEHAAYSPCWGDCPWEEHGPCESYLYASGSGNSSCKQNAGSLLTSPIAYIKKIPIDPFMTHYMMQYLYWGDYSVRYRQSYDRLHRNFALGYHISVKQVGWAMRSPGPNIQIWSWDEEPIYDPTNGTVSNGDIWYLGKGRGFVGGGGYFDKAKQRF